MSKESTDKKNHYRLKKLVVVFIFLIIISCSVLLYSRYIGTKGIMIKEYKINYSSLSDDFYGLKIVHITDIHYGRTVLNEELEILVKKINLTKPDVVVLTGDLIDKDTKLTNSIIDNISRILAKIDVSIKKYAIKGNHDYNFTEWNLIIEKSGFINLNDTYDLIYTKTDKSILISGISTNIYGDLSIKDKVKKINESIETTDPGIKPNYSILLIHEPDFIEKIDYTKYNLILAGHSHNGQVRLPIIGAIIKPSYAKKYYDEYYKIKTTDLYISSGIGTSEINFRLFNRPSFNLYRLTNK